MSTIYLNLFKIIVKCPITQHMIFFRVIFETIITLHLIIVNSWLGPQKQQSRVHHIGLCREEVEFYVNHHHHHHYY